ncbi:hypothetical protein A2U01_0108436 [Trifolium medium]|uniref:Uncharacterized protein n=1 Tax=Trifolium medium TaxID=97028 RepID=A0A392VK36_9FABA|nr:hypothetical protein [Trifolium medium]
MIVIVRGGCAGFSALPWHLSQAQLRAFLGKIWILALEPGAGHCSQGRKVLTFELTFEGC